MTVLMTTHYMDGADTYCDRIALMHQGTIRAEGTPAELKAGLARARGACGEGIPPGSGESWGARGAEGVWGERIPPGSRGSRKVAGVLTKLMVTPTPRSALITGKAFAAGVRSVIQGVVVVILSALLGVALTHNPLKLLASAGILVPGSAFFACLSMTIAGIALKRDRLMGIGQAITMPLFFSSSALYPTAVMPGWLQAISTVNPLTYEVEALRSLLVGTSTNLWLDFGVLAGATVAGITASALLLPRLAR